MKRWTNAIFAPKRIKSKQNVNNPASVNLKFPRLSTNHGSPKTHSYIQTKSKILFGAIEQTILNRKKLSNKSLRTLLTKRFLHTLCQFCFVLYGNQKKEFLVPHFLLKWTCPDDSAAKRNAKYCTHANCVQMFVNNFFVFASNISSDRRHLAIQKTFETFCWIIHKMFYYSLTLAMILKLCGLLSHSTKFGKRPCHPVMLKWLKLFPKTD